MGLIAYGRAAHLSFARVAGGRFLESDAGHFLYAGGFPDARPRAGLRLVRPQANQLRWRRDGF